MTTLAVIMAGGIGERFWPLSRPDRPKQLLRLTGSGLTMLEESVKRIEPLVPLERVFLSTSRELAEVLAADGPVPAERILAEPARRNTAGALVWSAAMLIAQGHEDATMAVLTADQLIQPEDGFRETVHAALGVAESTGGLVTIGVPPSRPETGYGYIEVGDIAGEAYEVRRFREKPSRELAEEFLASGEFLWNSGMFFWKLEAFRRELTDASPLHAEVLEAIVTAIQKGDQRQAEQEFDRLPSLSIDYALMERTRRAYVVRARFEWDDLGAWDSLLRAMPQDGDGNVTVGSVETVDTRGSVLYNASGRRLCALGLEDVVVVVGDDAVLVCSPDRAQDVRRFTKHE